MRKTTSTEATKKLGQTLAPYLHAGDVVVLSGLEDASELEDVGYYDLVEGDGVAFLEWGEKFPEELPYGYLDVSITVSDDGSRVVRVHSVGDRARQLLCVWSNDSRSHLVKTSSKLN